MDGIAVMAATPHVRADYPTTAARMEDGVESLRRDLAGLGIALEVVPGGEVDIDWMEALATEDLVRFTLGQSGRYLLLEFPYVGWPPALDGTVHRLARAGIRPLLAHPERNPQVQEDPGRLEGAVGSGALVQITVASLDGRLGRGAKRTAERLLERRLVHVLASDAHGPETRAVGLAAGAEALGDRGLARYLTEEAPAAILAGEPVEAPPRRATRRRLPRLWGGGPKRDGHASPARGTNLSL